MTNKEKELFTKDLSTLTLEEIGEATWLSGNARLFRILFFLQDKPLINIKQSLDLKKRLKISNLDIKRYFYA